jgi:hypothetical protein
MLHYRGRMWSDMWPDFHSILCELHKWYLCCKTHCGEKGARCAPTRWKDHSCMILLSMSACALIRLGSISTKYLRVTDCNLPPFLNIHDMRTGSKGMNPCLRRSWSNGETKVMSKNGRHQISRTMQLLRSESMWCHDP